MKTAPKPEKRTSAPAPMASGRGFLPRWPEIINIVLLAVTLGIAVHSVEKANWVSPQPSLMGVLLLSMLAGVLLSRLPLSSGAKLGLVVFFGGIVTVWQTFQLLSPPAATYTMGARFMALWQTISGGDPEQYRMHFALFVISLTWITGYLATWAIIKRKNPWVAVTIGIIVILANLRQLTDNYYIYFPVYVFAAMLLVIQTRLIKEPGAPAKAGTRARGMVYFIVLMVCLNGVLITGAWFIPEIKANQVQGFVAEKVSLEESLGDWRMNIFSRVESKYPSLTSEAEDTIRFAGDINNGEEVNFVVKSSRKLPYWRIKRYDVYHSWGWTVGDTSEHAISPGTVVSGDASPGEMVTATVVNKLKTDLLLTAGEFLSASTEVQLTTTGADIQAEEVVSVSAPFVFSYNDSYEITSRTISASPEELAQAPADYPSYITSRYLQLPPDFPRRVAGLSRRLTRESETPYDRAIAIKSYLSGFSYIEKGASPPVDVDAVEYFLFNQKSGNCTNFASAMVVMLRSVGVPARLASGYLGRSWDPSDMTLSIRQRDYHAWAEVYFTGYGWIEFEATPGWDIESPSLNNDEMPADGGVSGNESDSASANVTGPGDDSSETTDTGEPASDNASAVIEPFSPPPPGDLLSGAAPGALSIGQWLGLGCLAACVSLFLVILWPFLRRWRYDKTDPAFSIYYRVCRLASLAGIRAEPGETPLEYGHRLVMAYPEQAEAITDIIRTYLESRFSPEKRLTRAGEVRLIRCWRLFYRMLLKRVLRRVLLLTGFRYYTEHRLAALRGSRRENWPYPYRWG